MPQRRRRIRILKTKRMQKQKITRSKESVIRCRSFSPPSPLSQPPPPQLILRLGFSHHVHQNLNRAPSDSISHLPTPPRSTHPGPQHYNHFLRLGAPSTTTTIPPGTPPAAGDYPPSRTGTALVSPLQQRRSGSS